MARQAGNQPEGLRRLGKYVIQKRLGAGGMGTVFLAVDAELNRTVALKVLPRKRASNPVLVRRFKSEGQAAALLEHENIVRVYEAGEADGYLYLALEYIEGIDVHELVEKREVLPVKRSLDIIRQTALALEHAHARHIVHRDIKPSNLMIKRDGSVKLADMGLARSIDDTLETNITRAGTTVGTVDYMAPEQARNSKATDARSDIYSLGCTWYHMLTGQPPFPEGSMTNKLQSHAIAPIPDPRHLNDAVPEAVVAVLNRMMAKKPEDRYQSATELLEDLDLARRNMGAFNVDVMAALADEVPVQPPSKTSRRQGRTPEGTPPRTPPRTSFSPVDVPRGSVDLHTLRFVIPAVLVLAVLGLIFWVARQGGEEGLSGSAADTNPYKSPEEDDDASEQASGRAESSQEGPRQRPTVPGTQFNGTTPRVFATFPGVEDVAPGTSSASGLQLIPDWVQAFRTPVRSQLAPRRVCQHPQNPQEFSTLTEALQDLPAAGAVITLADAGPFALEPTAVRNCSRLVIAAAEGVQPLVVIPAELAVTSQTGLSVTEGILELDGVHFALLDPAGDDFTMIRVDSGELVARNCSVTYADRAGHQATGLRLRSPRAGVGGRGLLENVVMRGAA